MSEAAAAAPAAAPAAPASTPAAAQSTQTQPADSKAAPAAKAEASAWDDSRESQLLELLKSSPYGKLKVNGQEEVLDSSDKLKSALLDASRGRGAKRVVEQANKERAEAAEAKKQADLAMRALKGDAEARRALGIIDPQEQAERERALAEVPPEVRAMYEELEATKAELAKVAEEKAAAAKAEEERKEAALREQVRTEGLGFAKTLVEQLGTGDEADAALPYVLQAVHDLQAEGLKMGRDVSPEHVLTLARQMFEADGAKRIEKLSPKSFIGAALKRLETMPAKEVVQGLSPKMRVALAKELALLKTTPKAAPVPVPSEPQRSERPTTSTLPQPMSPFRWAK